MKVYKPYQPWYFYFYDYYILLLSANYLGCEYFV